MVLGFLESNLNGLIIFSLFQLELFLYTIVYFLSEFVLICDLVCLQWYFACLAYNGKKNRILLVHLPIFHRLL